MVILVKAIFKIFSYFIYTLTQNWTHYKNIFPETMYQLYQLTYLFGLFRTLSLCLPPSKQNGASCQNPSKVNYQENCPDRWARFFWNIVQKVQSFTKKKGTKLLVHRSIHGPKKLAPRDRRLPVFIYLYICYFFVPSSKKMQEIWPIT